MAPVAPEPEMLPDMLKQLSPPRLGRFGEFIFKDTLRRILGVAAEDWHRDQADFVAGGRHIDVKTTRQGRDRAAGSVKPHAGKRLPNVGYAVVAFHADGAAVALEDKVLEFLTWPRVSELWVEWGQRRRTRPHTEARAVESSPWKPIASDLTGFFAGVGYRARLIRRTCQHRFGKQSPHDLLRDHPGADGVTVFLDFADRVAPGAVRRIIAFPDCRKDELPRRASERNYLSQSDKRGKFAKVDLDRVPADFVFTSIGDLKEPWRTMLGQPGG